MTALTPIAQMSRGVWVGWDGGADGSLEPFREFGIDMVPVSMSAEEIKFFYDGFANATLWPLFHDVIVKPEYSAETWDAYREINERFAEHVSLSAAPSATVWVQDYQLTLVPQLLRARRPDVTIGFFNHIPFPPYEIFAQLPWAKEVIAGLLGADLLGFQRAQDANNFLRACRRTHNVRTADNSLEWPSPDGAVRTVKARHYPIGIEPSGLLGHCRRESTRKLVQDFRQQTGQRTVLLGVDRLDYTKGIEVRLRAIEELLHEGEISADDVVFVQVGTPSRERVDAYQQLRNEIELAVGRINGAHSSLGVSPVVYLRSTVSQAELVALYRLADVMLVTPLRDGMNLVAKEYVACRTDHTGVLVLSRFTGASDELTSAVLVNPHDTEGVKQAILQAVRMSRREQRKRMRHLRHEVLTNDVRTWASTFLSDLQGLAVGHGNDRAVG